MAEVAEDLARLVKGAIVRSAYGGLIGAELIEVREDFVRLPYRDALTTLGDTVHGGVISGLIDIAATASFWASPRIAAGSRGTTIGLSVNFLSAARG